MVSVPCIVASLAASSCALCSSNSDKYKDSDEEE